MSGSGIIRVEHFYSHPPAAVWRALTDPALHARWFVKGDVRAEVGHRFELDMGKWGKQPCEVLVAEPERVFQYRFAADTLNTIITWRLTPEGTGTRLEMTQEGFDLDSPFGRQALEGMKPGWPRILERLPGALQEASPNL
ncbi:MAG TPA: SRPBCC domain-containing protein [Polyangiaceae bacterium]|nr:SRPBCC domain-containing protein [Polyangiaceae bacterium]